MWSAKQQIIFSLSESLWDVYNYGLFQPAGEGRDAKFLEEERLLRDYARTFEKGVPYLEVGPTWANARLLLFLHTKSKNPKSESHKEFRKYMLHKNRSVFNKYRLIFVYMIE